MWKIKLSMPLCLLSGTLFFTYNLVAKEVNPSDISQVQTTLDEFEYLLNTNENLDDFSEDISLRIGEIEQILLDIPTSELSEEQLTKIELTQIEIGLFKNIHGIKSISCVKLESCFSSTNNADADPPTLNGISVDKASIDVTDDPQTVTWTVDATDESGIDWEAFSSSGITWLVLRDPSGASVQIYGDNSKPGIFSRTFDSSDARGAWRVVRLRLSDNLSNERDWGFTQTSSSLKFGLSLIHISEPTRPY